MLTLAALAFVSPVFGLQLELDAHAFQLSPDTIAMAATADELANPEGTLLAEMAYPDPTSDSAPPSAGSDDGSLGLAADALSTTQSPDDVSMAASDVAPPPNDVARLMARRARLARAHRRLGMSTWGAMTAAVITGTLQYINLYGFFSPLADTRCVRGNAFFGQESCVRTPVFHATAAGLTAALYYTTFALSIAMPDPIGLDRGNSESARSLRQHKRMRWIHFTGMALQGVLGTVISNAQWFGLDRANDYRTLQTLATVHLLTGYATYGVLTYTGARMAF